MAHKTIYHQPKNRTTALPPLLLFLIFFTVMLLLSSCGKSDEKICIDQQSHLWNDKAYKKEENQIYWNAVAQCRDKETFARVDTRIKIVKIHLNFVDKLANS